MNSYAKRRIYKAFGPPVPKEAKFSLKMDKTGVIYMVIHIRIRRKIWSKIESLRKNTKITPSALTQKDAKFEKSGR